MRRPTLPSRRSVRAAGDARAKTVAQRLGASVRERRLAAGWTQTQLASLVGCSQQEISHLELGRATSLGVRTWARCAAAFGTQLAAFLERATGTDLPRDIEHLRRQNLLIERSAPGGWEPEPESAVAGDPLPFPHSIDVLLTRRARREAAVIEVWDLVLDGGAAMRGLDAKVLATRQRLGEDWHVEGLLVVRATQRNRRLVTELHALLAAKYPASSSAWLEALATPDAPLPAGSGLAWTDVEGTRLFAARLGRLARGARGPGSADGGVPAPDDAEGWPTDADAWPPDADTWPPDGR